MSKRVKKSLVVTGVIGVGAITIFGCADIIGANFDRDLDAGGSGGADGGKTAVVASASTGIVEPECELSSNSDLKETIELTVWAQNPAKLGAGAKNFFTTSDKDAPGGLYVHQLMQYKLYAAPDGTARHLVYQCTTKEHHEVTLVSGADCSCLGYAVQIEEGSGMSKEGLIDLLTITGIATDVTALLPSPADEACVKFGNSVPPSKACVDSTLYGPK